MSETNASCLEVRMSKYEWSKCKRLFLEKEPIDYQGVNSGAVKAANGFACSTDNWLTKQIEGCVHQNGHTALFPKLIQKAREERVGFIIDRVHPSHSIRKPG